MDTEREISKLGALETLLRLMADEYADANFHREAELLHEASNALARIPELLRK